MTPFEEAHARIWLKRRGRRRTDRRWWLRCGAVHVGFARLSRKMGNPPGEVAAQLAEARFCWRMAAYYDRRWLDGGPRRRLPGERK